MKKTTLFRIAFAAANPSEFRKAVNPSHQSLLSDFAFLDEQSEANALQAMRGDPLPFVANPITIILGLPGNGKTRLAGLLAKEAQGVEVLAMKHTGRAEVINKEIEAALLTKTPAILFDNLYQKKAFQAVRLLENATGSPVVIRRLGSHGLETLSCETRIYITAPFDAQLPEDLVRRSRVIRLGVPFDHWLSAKVKGSGKSRLARMAAHQPAA